MRKEDLRKLRTLNATPKMVLMAKGNTLSGHDTRNGCVRHYHTIYGVYLRCQMLQGILKVAVFLPKKLAAGKITPSFEVFINPLGEEYITRILKADGTEDRWSGAMIHNVQDYDYYGIYWGSKYEAWINPEGKKTIQRELSSSDENAFQMIRHWQQKCHDKRIYEQEKRQQAPWDADMALVPAVPENFKKWMQKDVVKENFIIYEYSRKKIETGYCTRCEKEVTLSERPMHRKDGVCPKCKRSIQYISINKIGHIWTDTEEGEIIQKIKGGIVVRRFNVRNSIDVKNHKVQSHMHEENRFMYIDGKFKWYSYTMYKNKYHRWCYVGSVYSRYYDNGIRVYKRNMTQIADAISNHSALKIAIENDIEISVVKYLQKETEYPVIEKLLKVGMFRMAKEVLKPDWKTERIIEDKMSHKETQLHRILKVDRQRLKRLAKMDAGLDALMWMQQEKRENTEYDADMLKYFNAGKIAPDDLEFIIKKMTAKKIYNYLRRQHGEVAAGTDATLTTWRDYLNMAGRLKMDTASEMVYKPKDVYAAHAEAIELLERGGIEKTTKEVRKKFPKVDKVCPELKKYEWTDGKFVIVAPKGIHDIVREGTVLKHCIHTCDYYFDRISTKEAYLLFLRKAKTPDTPWYTLEVEPGGNIRQKRTVGDNQNPDFQTAVGFLKKWQQHVQEIISEEDKQLAEIADQKRQENYKNLRIKGNTIWHGRLQGQLLADVLEQDFMQVGG